MIKKKNGFMTFLCSLVPGAGEMYLGFMKEGLSIMCLAYGIFVFSIWADMSWLISAEVILWFYSLFNTHDKVSLPDEEFYALEDDYVFHIDRLLPKGNLNLVYGKQSKIFGWFLLFLGVSIIWKPSIRNLLAALRVYISDDFSRVVGNYLYSLPQFVIAGVLIVCGVRLILRKKTEIYMEQDADPEEKV